MADIVYVLPILNIVVTEKIPYKNCNMQHARSKPELKILPRRHFAGVWGHRLLLALTVALTFKCFHGQTMLNHRVCMMIYGNVIVMTH